MTSLKGETEYEGTFAEYPTKHAIPSGQLKIDPERSRDHKVWIDGALVPIVYLRNGSVLVPTEAYEQAVQTLSGGG